MEVVLEGLEAPREHRRTMGSCGERREKVHSLPRLASCVTLSRPTFLSPSFFLSRRDFPEGT